MTNPTETLPTDPASLNALSKGLDTVWSDIGNWMEPDYQDKWIAAQMAEVKAKHTFADVMVAPREALDRAEDKLREEFDQKVASHALRCSRRSR